MKKVIVGWVIFSLLWIFVGCDKEAEVSPEASKVVSQETSEICSEHGVPENECTRCNPSLIPKFKEKGDWCEEHNLPESQDSFCNPALAGKILLSPESHSLAEIKTETVGLQSLPKKTGATGKISYNEKNLAHITPRVSGRVEKVFVFLQSKVEAGESLVSLYSPEYLTAQSEYIQAEERLKRMNQMPVNEEEATAEAIYRSTRQKLIIFGVSEEEILQLEESHTIQPYLILRAPFSGTILVSNAIQGDYVQPETILYRLANLSTLWVMADVYERDIAKVKNGQEAEITTSAYPDETFKGRVAVIGDVLDEKTRTFKVRIDVENPQGKLKPEMFVGMSILASNDQVVAIPLKTVLVDGEEKMVFVSLDDQTYSRRVVKLGRETDGWAEVIEGLSPGEKVVTEGNFLLKSELFKSKLGAGCAE